MPQTKEIRPERKDWADFRAFSDRIVQCELQGAQRYNFLREASRVFIEFSGCDSVEVQILEGRIRFCCEARRDDPDFFRFDSSPWQPKERAQGDEPGASLDELWNRLAGRTWRPVSDGGRPLTLWSGNASCYLEPALWADLLAGYASLSVIPLIVGTTTLGFLQLRSKLPGSLAQDEVEFYEAAAQMLAIALSRRRSNALLRERVKELTCLYGIAQVAAQSSLSLEETFARIVELLPPAWLYPEIASARITAGGHSFLTHHFREGIQKQSSIIIAGQRERGAVEVLYSQEMSERDEGPFLREERSLIDAVAREVGILIEQRESESERAKLQDQLRHADRLATIGQLAAGVAHELNEPLGNILGFAQLAEKCAGLPDQAREDLEKITASSLYARQVIRNLMIFARQMPQSKVKLSLNRVVEEGITFFDARCAKAGVELRCDLQEDLPEVTADRSQMMQVLVNLVVNAIQAMPGGGRLSVKTQSIAGAVSLIVEDTGEGMTEEVRSKIFLPFFTTKGVNEGTGLGLPVIHGIVAAHQGSIIVESAAGRGSCFEIRLPLDSPTESRERDSV